MKKLLSVLSSALQGGLRGGLLILALLATTSLWAHDFQSGDLYYNITSDSTVAVTYQEYNSSSNYASIYTVTVPETVTYDGTTYSVTSIGSYAFYQCTSMTSVTIPNRVTSIGECAFSDCSSLTSVTIPNSITSIGDAAFYNCSSLTSVTIGESVTSIGWVAFAYCSSLTSVTIPNSVTSIGYYAFDSCSSLTSVTIGNGVTSIGYAAFAYCSSLTKTNYTGDIAGWCNIKFEGYDANPMHFSHNFYINDQEIKDLVIPESVTSIGGYAFSGCSSLTSVTIPNSVTSIGESAFRDCSSLTSVTIPNSVTSMGESAFDSCSSLTSVTIGNGVTSIGDHAFYNCSSLTSVTIPNSVTSIGFAAFWYCSSLTSITCEAENPPTVVSNAFYNISQSIPVYVPCGCVEAYKVTYGWEDFTNIQEPLAEYSITVDVNGTIMGTAKVDYNTFCEGAQISATPNFGYHFVQWSDGNTDNPHSLVLTQDTILTAEFAQSFSGQCGDSLYWELVDTTLHITGKGEMYDYKSNTIPWKLLVSSIKVLTIAEDVTKLSQSFGSCSVLESIVWNAKHAADTYSDGQYVSPIFYEIRSQIKSFTFGENVEYIPTYLCAGMDKLTSITIPNSVTSIGDFAFLYCTSLSSATIGNSVTSIGECTFYNCSSLTSVTIPNSVTSIGDSAFFDCSSLTSVTIGESVTSIGYAAFAYCSSLTSVTIPNSVTSIGDWAFNCNLEEIYCYPTTPPAVTATTTFWNYNATLYVPCDSKEAYEEHPVFGEFKNIKGIDDCGGGFVTTHIHDTICQGEVYEFGEYICDTTGTYTAIIGDVTTFLYLTVLPSSIDTITVEACDSYEWHGVVYTESGVYTYRDPYNPCVIEELHLTINKTQYAEATVVACDSYVWNDQTYTESGEYVYNTIATNGCDSIVTLHLTINKTQYAEESVTACDSYTWNDQTYTESGEYTYTTTTAAGCERIEVLHLTILPDATTESEELALCPSELPYEWYGQMLTEAGSYTATEQYAGMECDSVIHELTLNVYVQTLPAAVTLPIVRTGEAIDVTIPTAEIQAHIAAETWYAPNAEVAWYIMDNSDWAALSADPVAVGITEVTLKYVVDTDCGNVESDMMVINLKTADMENTQSQSPTIDCQKILYEDHIYILREDKIYNAMGQEL